MRRQSLRRVLLFLLSGLSVGVVQVAAQPRSASQAGPQPITRLFANVISETEDERDDWREFKNLKQLEDAEVTYYEHASVSLQGKTPMAAYFTLTSASGDWVHSVFYYFRNDGTLAKIHSQLNTFHGNVTVLKDKAYDTRGKQLRTATRVLDLKSGQPKKTRNFMDQEIRLYRRTQDLPFFKLL